MDELVEADALAATTSAAQVALMPAAAIMLMRPAAACTSWLRVLLPWNAVAAPALVSSAEQPQRMRVCSECIRSALTSKARLKTNCIGAAACTAIASLRWSTEPSGSKKPHEMQSTLASRQNAMSLRISSNSPAEYLRQSVTYFL
jgi:hypothetical protein